jgi:hypothetical protein
MNYPILGIDYISNLFTNCFSPKQFLGSMVGMKKIRPLYFYLQLRQDCQMVYLHTSNPNFGIFWKAIDWTILVYFMPLWCTYVFSGYLVYFVTIWYI